MSARYGTTSDAALSPGSPPGRKIASSLGRSANSVSSDCRASARFAVSFRSKSAGVHSQYCDVVLLADGAEAPVHRLARHRHQRADAGVLERDVLDGVAAKQHDLADVLVVLRLVPAVVGVRVVTVAELMAANRVARRRLDVDGRGKRRRAARPRQRAQQSADAEERAARVGADDPDDRPAARACRRPGDTLPVASRPPASTIPTRAPRRPQSRPRRRRSATARSSSRRNRCASRSLREARRRRAARRRRHLRRGVARRCSPRRGRAARPRATMGMPVSVATSPSQSSTGVGSRPVTRPDPRSSRRCSVRPPRDRCSSRRSRSCRRAAARCADSRGPSRRRRRAGRARPPRSSRRRG